MSLPFSQHQLQSSLLSPPLTPTPSASLTMQAWPDNDALAEHPAQAQSLQSSFDAADGRSTTPLNEDDMTGYIFLPQLRLPEISLKFEDNMLTSSSAFTDDNIFPKTTTESLNDTTSTPNLSVLGNEKMDNTAPSTSVSPCDTQLLSEDFKALEQEFQVTLTLNSSSNEVSGAHVPEAMDALPDRNTDAKSTVLRGAAIEIKDDDSQSDATSTSSNSLDIKIEASEPDTSASIDGVVEEIKLGGDGMQPPTSSELKISSSMSSPVIVRESSFENGDTILAALNDTLIEPANLVKEETSSSENSFVVVEERNSDKSSDMSRVGNGVAYEETSYTSLTLDDNSTQNTAGVEGQAQQCLTFTLQIDTTVEADDRVLFDQLQTEETSVSDTNKDSHPEDTDTETVYPDETDSEAVQQGESDSEAIQPEGSESDATTHPEDLTIANLELNSESGALVHSSTVQHRLGPFSSEVMQKINLNTTVTIKTYSDASNLYYALIDETTHEELFPDDGKADENLSLVLAPKPGEEHTVDRPNWALAPPVEPDLTSYLRRPPKDTHRPRYDEGFQNELAQFDGARRRPGLLEDRPNFSRTIFFEDKPIFNSHTNNFEAAPQPERAPRPPSPRPAARFDANPYPSSTTYKFKSAALKANIKVGEASCDAASTGTPAPVQDDAWSTPVPSQPAAVQDDGWNNPAPTQPASVQGDGWGTPAPAQPSTKRSKNFGTAGETDFTQKDIPPHFKCTSFQGSTGRFDEDTQGDAGNGVFGAAEDGPGADRTSRFLGRKDFGDDRDVNSINSLGNSFANGGYQNNNGRYDYGKGYAGRGRDQGFDERRRDRDGGFGGMGGRDTGFGDNSFTSPGVGGDFKSGQDFFGGRRSGGDGGFGEARRGPGGGGFGEDCRGGGGGSRGEGFEQNGRREFERDEQDGFDGAAGGGFGRKDEFARGQGGRFGGGERGRSFGNDSSNSFGGDRNAEQFQGGGDGYEDTGYGGMRGFRGGRGGGGSFRGGRDDGSQGRISDAGWDKSGPHFDGYRNGGSRQGSFASGERRGGFRGGVRQDAGGYRDRNADSGTGYGRRNGSSNDIWGGDAANVNTNGANGFTDFDDPTAPSVGQSSWFSPPQQVATTEPAAGWSWD
ncbi:hypothetical protein M422DRAFT_62702 [Sphaerobolus stellatus SS14]|nr:hypothetical protein M422DRAFT_62702 [Sphaerobolus stellatus SS14]